MDVKFPFDHFLQIQNPRTLAEIEGDNDDFFKQFPQQDQDLGNTQKSTFPTFTTEIKNPSFQTYQSPSHLFPQSPMSKNNKEEKEGLLDIEEKAVRGSKGHSTDLDLSLSLDLDRENPLEKTSSLLSEQEESKQRGAYKRIQTAKEAKFQIDLIPSHEDLMDQVSSSFLTHMDQKNNDFIMDFKKVFENFVVGPSNNLAFAMAYAAAKEPGKNYPCLFLHSGSGLGKTHLLNAVANRIREAHPSLRVYLGTAREFMTEMMEAMSTKKLGEFRKKFYEIVDVLLLDDVHELKNRPGTQNEFFHIFNELYNKGKQLILTADRAPKQLEGIEERLKTRLTWGLVLDIHEPEYETRTALLRKKIQDDDLYIPDDVIELIARSIKGNMRELEGSLIRLQAYSSVMKVDIDIEIAKEQLKIIEQHQPNKIDLEGISRLVSQYFQIPVVDLRSKVRQRKITLARHLAMYLCYKYLQETLTSIALFFGKKDHTSTLHAIEKISQQKNGDLEIQQYLNDLEKYF